MDMNEEQTLTNREKNLIATGAAMGAGCRQCADKLYSVAVSLKIPDAEILKACQLGLEAKAEAIATMRAKVSELLGNDEKGQSVLSERLALLTRIASSAAANSAPDVLAQIEEAREYGVTPDQIRITISLGRMVRKNAAGFSDREVSDGLSYINIGGEDMCCPPSPGDKSSPACTCG